MGECPKCKARGVHLSQLPDDGKSDRYVCYVCGWAAYLQLDKPVNTGAEPGPIPRHKGCHR